MIEARRVLPLVRGSAMRTVRKRLKISRNKTNRGIRRKFHGFRANFQK